MLSIDPVAFRVFGFDIYWYALAYIVGILLGFRCVLLANRFLGSPFSENTLEPFLNWAVLGILVGGRLGHVLYEPALFWEHPEHIFAIRQGGMSFHGGFLGVLLSAWLFSRRRHLDFWRLMDLLAVGTPVGLLLGRCANFINGELYGHPTTMPWGIVFPRGGPEPRHPSQLYEALFEGLILGALLLVLARLRGSALAPGRLAGWFAMGYGVFRIALEQFRALDSAFNEQVFEVLHMSLGQALTLPLLLMGWYLLRREHHEPQTEALPTERETKKPPPRDAKPPHGRYKAESE